MKELFDFLVENKVTPNSFYTLWGIVNKVRPANINIHTELRLLMKEGFIEDVEKGTLTDKGNKLVEDASNAFGNMRALADRVAVLNDDDNVMAYINMFPKGKLPSGKPARLPKNDIKKCFDWFFKNYDYSWETILSATAYYLDTYEKTNFLYMKNSQYFIRKQNIDKTWESELAGYCEIILNGGHNEDDNHIQEKVV